MGRGLPAHERAGVLFAAFLAGFLFAVIVGVTQRVPGLCVEGQDGVACVQQWLGAIGPTAGIVVSAWFITRQIEVNRAQFLPPAIDYLNKSNENLAKVRHSISAIEIYAQRLSEMDPQDMTSVRLAVSLAATNRVDTIEMSANIAASHLDDAIERELRLAGVEWIQCDYLINLITYGYERIDTLSDKVAIDDESLNKTKQEQEINAEKLAAASKLIMPTIVSVKGRIAEVYAKRHARLVKVGHEVARQIDDD